MQDFQNYIKRWFKHHGRHELPWRQGVSPYEIMVSEIMLQQTQVDRVIPKYISFLKTFPKVEDLAKASPAEVIRHWQGLGYNRRGLNLKRAAEEIAYQHQGAVPKDEAALLSLPGIGPYTASAIQAFAFNQPSIVIETNIRTVFIYHFFPKKQEVTDQELTPLIEASLDQSSPGEWYAALMDYGTYLKKVLPNPTRKSSSYNKQSRFTGSNRQLRGQILKALTLHDQLSDSKLAKKTSDHFSNSQLFKTLETLSNEGFITRYNGAWQLRNDDTK